jgi:hypothetical protein
MGNDVSQKGIPTRGDAGSEKGIRVGEINCLRESSPLVLIRSKIRYEINRLSLPKGLSQKLGLPDSAPSIYDDKLCLVRGHTVKQKLNLRFPIDKHQFNSFVFFRVVYFKVD